MESELLKDVRKYAAEHDRTMTSVIEEAIRNLLAMAAHPADEEPYVAEPFSVGELAPGIDWSSNRSIREATERDGKYGVL
jgi:hypothetical protein